MASPSPEVLTIQVNFKGDEASRKIRELRDDIVAIDSATRSSGFSNLKSLADSMTALGKASAGLNGVGPQFANVAKSAETLFNTFKTFDPKDYSSKITSLTKSLEGMGGALGGFAKAANSMERLSKVASDPNLPKNLQNMAQQIVAFATSVTQNMSDEVISRFERIGSAMAGLTSGAGKGFNLTGMSSSANIAAQVFTSLGSKMKTVIDLGWKVTKVPFKMILGPVQSVARGLENMTRKFTSFLSGIGRIALYRAIRTGIKMVTSSVREGVNNLYVWAGMVGNSFKPTMDSLATSFLYLKNSIGAAVSPLLDAMAPALEAVVNQIVDVLNIFNQVVATMTGASTWRKAIRSAADYSDNISGLGHGAQDATDAVKELKRTILGFDEINKLEDKTKTLAPSTNGKDPTGMFAKQGAFAFEEVQISQKALDIAKTLKDAWEKGDFTAIGDMIGQKIGNALLNVPWESKIQPTVEKFARSFGTLLNGMFDYNGRGGHAMWDGIAYTIYSAINTALLGYVTFFDTVHWDGIGEGIGAALKNVVYGIKWDWVRQALSAFPNAVIDALTGFTKQFSTNDFYNLGRNIGATVSGAIADIKWGDFFGNAVKIATGLLQALNGALSNFDWVGVKDAILTGIKNVPKKSWADLGTSIGNAIFNIVDFGANLVDTLVKAFEAVPWGDLASSIWTGINNKVKEHGGWDTVTSKLAGWIGDHIGTISLILTFLATFSLAKQITKNLIMAPISAAFGRLGGKQTSGGTWTSLLSTISITAGISLMFSNWNGKSAKSKIATAIGGGLAAAGIISKATKCTFSGSLIAFGIGTAITLSIRNLFNTAKDCGVNSDEFLDTLAHGIIGAVIGLAISGGNIKAGILGFSIGTELTLLIEKLFPNLSGVNDKEFLTDFEKEMEKKGIDPLSPEWTKNYFEENSKKEKEKWSQFFSGIAGLFGGTKTDTKDFSVGTYNTANRISVGTLTATLDEKTVPNAWSILSKQWLDTVSKSKVAKFITEGLRNDGKTWWERLVEYWGSATNGKTTSEFQTKGLKNQKSTWWNQVFSWWGLVVAAKKVGEFTTQGLRNQNGTWWSQLATAWNYITGRFKTSEFSTQGVKNEGYTWRYQTEGYWNDATRNMTLEASVGIGNPWNAFYNAWNSMQTYFNKNVLTAYVKTVQTGTQTGNSITGALTNNKKKKASGGVYKNGQWHDITNFAAGGSPMSGEMFIAREAGPELVGTIGGNTAVMNNDQIVASVSAGVAQAVASVLGGGNTNEITIKVDSETLYRMVKKGERKASGRYGTAVAIG